MVARLILALAVAATCSTAVGPTATFSAGYTTPSAFNFNTRAAAGSVFERFKLGSTHPCWYDPQHPRAVMLVRGPGGAYVLALLPLPVLLIGLDGLTSARRRRREGKAGARIGG